MNITITNSSWKTEPLGKLKFYTFNQNNSGGKWHVNDRVAHFVCVEAENADAANRIAEEIGVYFDGENDCRCCGDRWSRVFEDDGKESPSEYGKPLEEILSEMRAEAFIYFANGTKRHLKMNNPTEGKE